MDDNFNSKSIGAFTIENFCEAFSISRTLYFQLRKDGIGPEEMKLRRRKAISYAAALRWAKDREKDE